MPLRTGRASRKKLLWAFAVRATSEAAVRRSLGRPWKSSIPHSPASSADARWFSVQKITPSAPAAIPVQSHCVISRAVGQSTSLPLAVTLPPCISVIQNGFSPAPERMMSAMSEIPSGYCARVK